MNDERYFELIEMLVSRTEKEEITWKKTAEEDSYLASFTNYSILPRMDSPTIAPEEDYTIAIIDRHGDWIEGVNGRDLNAEKDRFSKYDSNNYYTILKSLFALVRKQVLGIKKALTEILDELKEDPIPF